MKRYLPTGLLTLGCLLALAVEPAAAQAPYNRPTVNPYYRPPFSPYLNLLRRDNNAALNYYGLVRPEIEFRNSIQQLGQQVQTLENQPAAEGAQGFPATGHATQFMTFSHFYPALGGGTGRRSGSQPATTPTYSTGRPLQSPGNATPGR